MSDDELPKELSNEEAAQLFEHAKAGGPPQPISDEEYWELLMRVAEAVSMPWESFDHQDDADHVARMMQSEKEMRFLAGLVEVPLKPFLDDWRDLNLSFAEHHTALNSTELTKLLARANHSKRPRRVPGRIVGASNTITHLGQVVWQISRDHSLNGEEVLCAYDRLQAAAVTAGRTPDLTFLWQTAAGIGSGWAWCDQDLRIRDLGDDVISEEVREAVRGYRPPTLFPLEETVVAIRSAVLMATAVFVADVADEADLWTILGPATIHGGIPYEALPRRVREAGGSGKTKAWLAANPQAANKIERLCREVAVLTERDCVRLLPAHALWQDQDFRHALISASDKLGEMRIPTLFGEVRNAFRAGHLPSWVADRTRYVRDPMPDDLLARSLTSIRARYYLAIGGSHLEQETRTQLVRAVDQFGLSGL